MNKSKLLIVEGNTNEENFNFDAAGCIPQSENFKLQVKKIDPSYDIDIVQPGDDKSISKIISSLKKYMGIIRTTFLINSKGKIHKIWSNVRVKDHAKEVLEELKNI